MKKSKQDKEDVICLEVDNDRAIGNFYSSDVDVESSEVDDRLEDNVEYSDLLSQQRDVSDIEDTKYETGDTIKSTLSDGEQFVGGWPLPSPDPYGLCNDMNTGRWLISEDYPTCRRREQPGDICSTSLNAATYTSNLKIQAAPNSTVFIPITDVIYYKRDLTTLQ